MLVKTRLLCVALASFCLTSTFAQSNFKPGSVVTQNGETIEGLIDYRQWRKNPSSIKFQTAANTNPVTYTVKDLASFEVNGLDRYITAIIKKDIRPVEMAELERAFIDTIVTDTVFLRLLVSSNYSLYQFTDTKPHFYIKEGNGDYQELQYKVFLVDRNSRLSRQYIFRDQLKSMMPAGSESASLDNLLASSNYSENDLVKVVDKMNSSLSNGTTSYKVKRQKQSLSFFVGAGMLHSTLKYQGEPDENTALNYTSSTKPLLLGGFDFAMWRNMQRLKLRFELAWYKTEYHGDNNPSATDSIRYHLSVSSMAPSLSALYNVVNHPKQKLYLGLGFQYNFSSYPENILHKKYYNNPGYLLTRSPHLDLKKSWFALNARTGFILNDKFEIAATASFGSFITYLKPTLYSANLNYHF